MTTKYYHFNGIPDKVYEHILTCRGNTLICVYMYKNDDKNPTWKRLSCNPAKKSFYFERYINYKEISREEVEAKMFLDLI